ncbi:winged helix-turn-helix transcriptional regulator [Leucobacter denitrificans]|uniref:Winged helix-turn-helix transcriptional regulator n=1 Tax=Leucobacter denitrificans TaxID=683042 RepID=A0A7G9S7Z4_9MICO|nr:winged helix-turn-helix transcriptional regulator [Leucobacter denitrificans]
MSRGLGGPPAIVRTIEALAKAKEALGVSEIADAVGVDQPRASRLVQQGVARGLFAREADPDDARRTRIALTEQGLRFAHGIRNHQRESLNTALESFTDEERTELARLLTKLANSWPA